MSTHVRSYREVLKASSVRGMLQRKARLTDVARRLSGDEPEATLPAPDSPTAVGELEGDAGDHRRKYDGGWLRKCEQSPYLHRWADDGGSVRCRQR